MTGARHPFKNAQFDAAGSPEQHKMNNTVEGGCLCGGLRYRLHETPTLVDDCHCVDCRRASGAPYVTWGVVKRERFELISGELRTIRHAGKLRSFAACCGTHLLFQDDENTERIEVTIASLDHPEPFAPKSVVWVEDRLPWVALDLQKPVFQRGGTDP